MHLIAGVNGLFQRLAQHADAERVDWSHLRLAVGGATVVEFRPALPTTAVGKVLRGELRDTL